MLRTVTILIGLGIATSPAAQTPEAALPETVAEVTERIDLEEVVCRNLRSPTGTRLQRRRTERVCLTRREWDHQTTEAQRAREDMDNGTCGEKCFGPQ